LTSIIFIPLGRHLIFYAINFRKLIIDTDTKSLFLLTMAVVYMIFVFVFCFVWGGGGRGCTTNVYIFAYPEYISFI
jgi:hypothetical protein